MYKHSIPYKRKGLFLLITIPMVIMYILIGFYLLTVNLNILIIYCAFFALTILFQSYNCIYWECPHVGKFCPGVGGFCILSSPIANFLIKLKIKQSQKTHNILCSIAYINFFGIIFSPIYFIYKLNFFYVLIYIGIILLYFIGMMMLICPFCGARNACPGGQTSTKLIKIFDKHGT